MSDKIVDFKEYKKKKKPKAKKMPTKEEVMDLIESTKPLSKRDLLQLELIESLAEHVHYLTKLLDRLLEENRELKSKLESTD